MWVAFAFLSLQAQGESPLQGDLDFLQSKLPEVHLNFGGIIAPEAWNQRCQKTRESLTGDTTRDVLKLVELVASLGVSHTQVLVGRTPFRSLPVRFQAYGDGLRVVATAPGYEDLAQARVLSIEGKDERAIISRLGRLAPAENEYWKPVRIGDWSWVAEAYQATGLAPSADSIRFRFELGSGASVERRLPSGSKPIDWKPSVDPSSYPPLLKPATSPYEIVDDATSKTLILNYRSCRADPAWPMTKVVEEFWRRFESGGFKQVAIDLRRNSGGSSSVLWPFEASLKSRKDLLNDKRVFVFISGRTFSSGVLNAIELRRLGAVLLGEPTGGAANGYGEVKQFELPNSKLWVTYCTKLFRSDFDSKGLTVMPDEQVPLRFADLAKGKDACLEWVREHGDASILTPWSP